MKKVRRILLVSAAVTAAFIQGCGCSDSKKRTQPEATFEVTGVAAKGILRNFQVAAHRFNDGILDPTPVASSFTDNLGAYSLDVPESYLNRPLLFRVTPLSTGSIMVCDLSSGCGTGINFGDDFPVNDTSFQLDSVVASVDDGTQTNISLLTDLASKLALEEIASGTALDVIQEAINDANSRIANRFGLVGNLTAIPIVNITDPEAVAAAIEAGNTYLVQYAAINSAIIQAMRADADGAIDFIEALVNFVSYFVENEGIAGNTSDETETSFADILREAMSIIEAVQEQDPENPLNLAAVIQALSVERLLAENEEPDSFDAGTPSDGAGDSDLQKAKNMVADLRDFAASVGESTLGGGLDVATVSDEFAMQIEAAEMANSADASYLLEALAMATKAIDQARSARDDNEELESFEADSGITVAIAAEGDMLSYTVEQDIEVEGDMEWVSVATDLVAHNSLVIEPTEAETETTTEINGSYTLVGTLSVASLRMTLSPGSGVTVTDLVHVEPIDDQWDNSSQSLSMFDMGLYVELAQIVPTPSPQSTPLPGTDALTLNGNLMLSVTELSADNTEDADSGSSEITLDTLSLQFSGNVSNTSGESFSFSLSVSGDASGISFVDSWNADGGNTTDETVDAWVDLNASLGLTAQLSGIPSVVSLVYSLDRTALDGGTNFLLVRYPGKLLRFQLAVEDGAPAGGLSVTNQDGVVLAVDEEMVEGESRIAGTITVNGVTYGTVEERENGVIVITYSDDTVVSL